MLVKLEPKDYIKVTHEELSVRTDFPFIRGQYLTGSDEVYDDVYYVLCYITDINQDSLEDFSKCCDEVEARGEFKIYCDCMGIRDDDEFEARSKRYEQWLKDKGGC